MDMESITGKVVNNMMDNGITTFNMDLEKYTNQNLKKQNTVFGKTEKINIM